MKYITALNLAKEIQTYIKGNTYITGSLKRKEENVNDIDLITTEHLDDVVDDLKKTFDDIGIDKKIIVKGDKYLSFKVGKIKVDVWFAGDKYELFYQRLVHDLDKGHSIYWRKQAKDKGYLLNQYGLFNRDGHKVQIMSKSKLENLLDIK